MKKFIDIDNFKTNCLKIMDEVNASGREICITKKDVPIIKICPIEKDNTSLFGKFAGTVHIKGDILKSVFFD